jgi:Flp pilus assembly protein TadD
VGVVAGIVTFRSERRVERAFDAIADGRPPGEAIDLFESSRALNPGAGRELAEAGLYLRSGRPGRAEERLREAADLEPESAQVWVVSTRVALALGRPDEARRRWARARRLDPRLPARLPPPL